MQIPLNNAPGSVFRPLFLLIFLCGQLSAEPAPDWLRAISSGGNGSDQGNAVKVDGLGNRYVTGSFSSNANFGGQTLSSAGGMDIFLAKYSSSGDLLWALSAGGASDEAGTDLDFDKQGNVYLAGWFIDNATFHSTDGTEKVVASSGWTIFLAKYTPAGVLAWLQTGTASGGNNDGLGIAVELASGTVYIVGRAYEKTTFSSSNGTQHTLAGPSVWHTFLVKYNTDGRFQWGQWNSASPNSIGRKVAVDPDSNAYLAGWLEGITTFHSADGNNLTVSALSGPGQTSSDYPSDAFVAKYDSSGNVKWSIKLVDTRPSGQTSRQVRTARLPPRDLSETLITAHLRRLRRSPHLNQGG